MALQPPPEFQESWQETHELLERFRMESEEAIATRDRRISVLTAELEAVRAELAEARQTTAEQAVRIHKLETTAADDMTKENVRETLGWLPDGAVDQEYWFRGEE